MNTAYNLSSAPDLGDHYSQALFKVIHDASPEGILAVNSMDLVISFNQRFIELWDIPEHLLNPNGEVSLTPYIQLLSYKTQKVKNPDIYFGQVIDLYSQKNPIDRAEIDLKDGRTLERVTKALHDPDGNYLGRVWFYQDISKYKIAEKELRDVAWHDQLTGLLNRSHFLESARIEFSRAARYQRELAVMIIDIDHFKAINDQYGHAVGDQVLINLSNLWTGSIRDLDYLSRFGGDEFTLLLPDTPLDSARRVANRLNELAHNNPVTVEGAEICCSISIGITLVNPDGDTIDDALRRADTALYQAKDKGRDCIMIYP